MAARLQVAQLRSVLSNQTKECAELQMKLAAANDLANALEEELQGLQRTINNVSERLQAQECKMKLQEKRILEVTEVIGLLFACILHIHVINHATFPPATSPAPREQSYLSAAATPAPCIQTFEAAHVSCTSAAKEHIPIPGWASMLSVLKHC
jgi:energy-converting hydrogenase Eha subunit A